MRGWTVKTKALTTRVVSVASFVVACAPSTDAGTEVSCAREPSEDCPAASCDDGVRAALQLKIAGLECRVGNDAWRARADAAAYCASLGGGWRLASKGEALALLRFPDVCAGMPWTEIGGSTPWVGSWTSTCAGAGLAWYARIGGEMEIGSVTGSFLGSRALCVRAATTGARVRSKCGEACVAQSLACPQVMAGLGRACMVECDYLPPACQALYEAYATCAVAVGYRCSTTTDPVSAPSAVANDESQCQSAFDAFRTCARSVARCEGGTVDGPCPPVECDCPSGAKAIVYGTLAGPEGHCRCFDTTTCKTSSACRGS